MSTDHNAHHATSPNITSPIDRSDIDAGELWLALNSFAAGVILTVASLAAWMLVSQAIGF